MLASGFGLGTRFHTAPFQCTISVLALPVMPTAHALLAEVAATPNRSPEMPNDAGPQPWWRGE